MPLAVPDDGAAFDIIIVGAGSAGCALAYKLSADPRLSVLLIEAGSAASHPMSSIPKGFARLAVDPRHSWQFRTGAQPHRERGGELWPRGRMLGGSSAINGMIYTRGQRADYDEWQALGNRGWDADTMMRCFRAMEDHTLGDDGVRGVGGPLRITAGHFRPPFAERLITAGEQLGLRRTEDFNGPDQQGIGYFAHCIRHGRRESAARAFLDPIRHRANLTIARGLETERIGFDARRAARIEVRRGGRPMAFAARREIILSAGTMNSPKLLQLSGVGDGDLLRGLGIDVIHHSPAVGAHMRDHQSISHSFRLQGERGNNGMLTGIGLWGSVLRYGLRRDGILSTGPLEVGAFLRSRAGIDRPDIELLMGPTSTEPLREGIVIPEMEKVPGLTIGGYVLRPLSEGSVAITSPDPAAQVAIDPRWLTNESDIETGVAIVELIRRFVRQPAVAPFIAGETGPGAAIETEADMRAYFLRHARTANHATGTCRMGPDDSFVTDVRLRVRGVEGLRIADCSVMPTQISGHTNGPAMAVGWRAGELIAEESRL